MAMIGDSHAALFAHGLGATGCVKATYGTGTSVMAPVDSVAFHVSNLATTVARTTEKSWSTHSRGTFPIPAMRWRGWPTVPD